jgi:predicted O-methyltransferase YrrM
MKYGFQPQKRGTDLVGYEVILDFIKQHHLLDEEGDMVEIGSFLGGGAYKLATFLEKNKSLKKLFVVDIFDPNFDWTTNNDGKAMAILYLDLLKEFQGRTQWEVFSEVTKECKNIHCLKGDSKKIEIPSTRLCFGFIDGDHSPDYVENDFYLIWTKLTSLGVVAFHDYEWDLPQTTAKIKELVNRHDSEIGSVYHNKDSHTLFVVKK